MDRLTKWIIIVVLLIIGIKTGAIWILLIWPGIGLAIILGFIWMFWPILLFLFVVGLILAMLSGIKEGIQEVLQKGKGGSE